MNRYSTPVSPDGTLYFISDRSGWWNLYRWIAGDITCLWETDAEFVEPHWVFGGSNYAFLSAERLICTCSRDGISRLAVIDTSTLKVTDIKTPYTALSSLAAGKENIAFLAASPSEAPAVVELDIRSGGANILRRSTDISFDEGTCPAPKPVDFPTEDGLTAHALYYAPKNCDYTAPENEKPPLMVISHGRADVFNIQHAELWACNTGLPAVLP
jgi:dipeptidyl aminopeptidase/acylaminoacyl peptidase